MMLLYEQLDTFMIGSKDFLEPVERFIKRNLPHATDQIISVRYDLLFRRERNIVLPWQPELHGLRFCDAGADVPFNNVDKLLREAQFLRDLDTCQGMFDSVRTGPANVMEQPALLHEFTIEGDGCTPCKGQGQLGDYDAVGYNFCRTSGLDKDPSVIH
jgi:hypothetical protein